MIIFAPVLTSIYEPAWTSIMPPHPIVTGLISIPYEFLQHIVERHDEVTSYLTQLETQIATLFAQFGFEFGLYTRDC